MFIFILFLYIPASWSLGVFHQQAPLSTFHTIASRSFCANDRLTASYTCSPSLFPHSNKAEVSLNLNLKADGDAVENGENLLFKEIEESSLRHIFEDKNFNSLTLDSRLEFNTNYFSVAYTPYYVVADTNVTNPAFPEVSMYLATKNELRVSSGWKLGKFWSFGGGVAYDKIRYAQPNFSIFDLATAKPNQLIKFQNKYSLKADLGLSFWGQDYRGAIPNITFQAKNLMSAYKLNSHSEASVNLLEPFALFETHYMTTLSYNITSKFGTFKPGIHGYYDENLSFYNNYYVLGLGYDLGKFGTTVEGGPYKRSMGLFFNSSRVDMGVIYVQDKELGAIQDSYSQSVYITSVFRL